MQEKKGNTDFIRFLKNERFIEWKLFPTDELDLYWSDFLKHHPEERKNIEEADKHFHNINLSPHKVTRERKHEAIQYLEQSLRGYTRKRNLRLFTYAAAACAALLLITILYIQKGSNRFENDDIFSGNYIIGNELESEDILFVTGNRTATFQGNVDIQIQSNKTARIHSEHAEDTEIFIDQHTMNKLIVPYGKRSEIMLPDGTRAWLNSGSSLEFPSTFSEDIREVFLTGEMYIEVAPDSDKSFLVHTPSYDIKVYGTTFNASNYADALSSVVLIEGSVSLQSATEQELYLFPKEQAVYSEATGSFDTREVDVHSFISWIEGYLTFEDTPVIEALKQIERYYNLSFNLEDNVSFKGLTCTGKIILSDNLDNVMTALSLISGTEYKRDKKSIFIYKK